MNVIPLDGMHVLYGTVCSGKTSELIRQLSIHSEMINTKVLYVNSKKDTRGDKFSSNSSYTVFPKKVDSMKIDSIQELVDHKEYSKYDVIGIDEAQFFKDISNEILEPLILKGSKIIVSGLLTDSEGKKFGNICELIRHSESSTQMHSFCSSCSLKGKLTHGLYSAIIKAKSKDKIGQIHIGSSDVYSPLCRFCYNDQKNS